MQLPGFEALGIAPGRGPGVLGTLACLVLASACASTPRLELPPVTRAPTQLVKPGKFVWQDLVTQDVAAARSFYAALFGWTYREGGRYTLVFLAPEGGDGRAATRARPGWGASSHPGGSASCLLPAFCQISRSMSRFMIFPSQDPITAETPAGWLPPKRVQ